MKNNYKLMIISLIPLVMYSNSLNAKTLLNESEITSHFHSKKNVKPLNNIKEKTFYVCPMHPNVISNEKINCPICGMYLEKAESSDNKENIEINVSKEIQQAMNLKTEKAKIKLYRPKIKTYGKIKYNEHEINHFHSKIEGWVEDSKNYSVGDFIKKGDVLFNVYSPDLIVAQQDYLLALNTKNVNNVDSLIKKAEIRLKLLGLEDFQIKELKKKKTLKYTTKIYSKESGYIQKLGFKNGMYIQPSIELLSTVNLDSVWLEGVIFDDKTNYLNATIEIEKTKSKINYIYPEVDLLSQGIKFRSTINNKERKFKIDQYYDIKIASNKPIIGLFIPKTALIQIEDENKVIIRNKNKKFEVKNVEVGYINSDLVQIKKGLMKNDEVVISGQFLIDSEASLKSSIMKME